ncbi:MAG: GNAT family N-acetyltransferase [Streptosporangiaceae bacterium]
MTESFSIRPVSPDEPAAFYEVSEHAFNASWPSRESLAHELLTFEADRSLAAFDGPDCVGTTAAYTFTMTVPGASAATAGVTAVSVLPTYRRRGILAALMRRQLRDISERGEALAALWASESGIYGRFGYGCASEHLGFTIRRGEGRLLPPEAGQGPGAGTLRLRAAAPEQVRAELTKVYETAATARPGMMNRDDRWWSSVLDDPEFSRQGRTPLRAVVAEDESGPRGYALFAARPDWGEDAMSAGILTIRELMWADPAACAAVWTDLLNRDLVSEVRVRQRPVDDPLLELLADRRRSRASLTDGLWVRLIDVPAALVRRRYACEVDTVIELTDGLLPENSGRWRLAAGGPDEPAPARCERTAAPADLSMTVRGLGAGYLGGTRLGALAAAGHLAELRPGSAARLSAAMSWDPAPWCPAIF